MQALLFLIAGILLGQPAVAADTVYLCRQNGKVTYAASPRSGECQPVDLKVLHPSETELERLAREKERKEAEDKALAEQQRQERQVRAQEEAARAAKRQARAAERGAAYEKEQLRLQELETYRQPDVLYAPYLPFARPRPPAPFPKQPGPKPGGSPRR